VNVRFFAQAISFIVKRRALRSSPTGPSMLARRANQERDDGDVVDFSAARTIAGLAPIGTVGVA
jgi:hypothetical protein